MKTNPKIAGPGFDLEVSAGTEPPHSAQCERLLLSAVLGDATPGAWALACAAGIKRNAFYLTAHQEVWTVAHELHRRGVAPVDIVVVAEELKLLGRLESLGGWDFLVTVTSGTPTTLHTRFLAEQLKLLWDLRYSMVLAQELREAALEFAGREAFVGTAGDIGQRLLLLGRRESRKLLTEEIAEVEADVTAAVQRATDTSHWFSSGLPSFDDKCKPFTGGREDQLIVIAGGSGMGKSVALRQLAGQALLQGKRVLSLSRETSTAGFVEMLCASWADFDLLHPELEQAKLEKFVAECRRMAMSWADKLLFCVQPTPATPLHTIEDLVEQVHGFVNLRGQPDVIVVDYLQLFGTRKRMGSREETVATVSHSLQALVRELPGTTMLVAAQLNESGLEEMRQIRREQNADGSEGRVIHRLPKPGDLRESQAIYHDADRVIFLYRPPVDCRGSDQRAPSILKPEVWWFQEKRRRGGVAVVRCWFEKRYTRFVEVARKEADAADQAEELAGGHVPAGGMDKGEFKRGRGKA